LCPKNRARYTFSSDDRARAAIRKEAQTTVTGQDALVRPASAENDRGWCKIHDVRRIGRK